MSGDCCGSDGSDGTWYGGRRGFGGSDVVMGGGELVTSG